MIKNKQTIDLRSSEGKNTVAQKTASEKFDDFVDSEIKSNEIDEGLSEIYQDEDGNVVDMKNLEIEHGHSWLYRAFILLFNLSLLLIVALVGYYYFNQYQAANSVTSVNLSISGPKDAIAGKEVSYVVEYKNLDRVDLQNVSVKLMYPENFIFGTSSPTASQENNNWQIGDLAMRRSGEIKITGRFVGEVRQNMVLLATMTYTPANFSSEFKKDASLEAVITDIGFDFKIDAPENVLVEDAGQLFVGYKQQDENYLDNFRLTVKRLDNLEFATSSNPLEPGVFYIGSSSSSSTVASTSTSIDGEIKIDFTFKERLNDKESLSLVFEYTPDGQNFIPFYKKDVIIGVLTKSINLSMLINASKDDQGVDFGQSLNYSISYANKGEQAMKNLVVMAVLDSDFLDWSSLSDKNKGKVRGNKISWTKDELKDFAELAPGQEGTIDFSINVLAANEINPVKNYQIKSYARFTLGDASSTEDKANNRSNEIINKINSDLNLKEQVKYFNDDNIAVGSGPLPPKVGETTGYKVYWSLNNSLNELNDLKIETVLPAYVSWQDKNLATVGTLSFDEVSRKVSWNLGKLPITTTVAEAEFGIGITPTSTDANRIMVLLNNTTVTASDAATQAQINKALKPKTTKLEDDQTVTDDGRIAN